MTQPTASITVRQATPEDADFLVHGNAALALETERIALDPDRLRDGVRALLADPSRGVYYIAESGGRRVGQMMTTFEWSDWRNGVFWWIQSVYVLPGHRGAGVFTSLYRHVEKLAKSDPGVCGLRLYVENGNARAQAAYQRVGMQPAVYRVFENDFVIQHPGS
jgi:GNAT superfamily N-acetyltransferase